MDVTIEAIKFDHDPNSATTNALTIRKNRDAKIGVSEWQYVNEREQPKTSVAAYTNSQGNALTIAVQLRKANRSLVQNVVVSAKGTGILGNVKQCSIRFFENQILSEWKVCELEGARVTEVGVGKWEIEWDWSLEPDIGPLTQQATKHVIYTLKAKPNRPWGQPGDKPPYELPWADALDWACRWAAQAKDLPEIAGMITREIYALGPEKLKFNGSTGAFSRMVLSGTSSFDLAWFLYVLKTQNECMTVSCTDCAILVSSFANLLGCNLYQSQMGGDSPFNTNPILLIGSQDKICTSFDYHEVAWEYPCTCEEGLFDSCLQVDGDPDPAGGDFEPMLGINIPLGDYNSKDYHFRLAQPGFYGQLCHAKNDSKIQRPILQDTVAKADLDPELERLLKKRHDFAAWSTLPIQNSQVFIWQGRGSRYGFFPATTWSLEGSRSFKGEAETPKITELKYRSAETDDMALRVLLYQCGSSANARSFLLNLLGEFQIPVLRRYGVLLKNGFATIVGDVAFNDPQDSVFLFVRANVVVFIQNAGTRNAALTDFARDLDVAIFNIPALLNEEIVDEQQFQLGSDTFRVGEEMTIESIEKGEFQRDTLYKFATESGEVFSRDNRLIYCSSSTGKQSIVVFTLRDGLLVSRQVIPIFVEPDNVVRTPIELISNNPNQKEKSAMAIDTEYLWSSIMLNSGGGSTEPTNMTRDGIMRIYTQDPTTGVITGQYEDANTHDATPLYGSIQYAGGMYNWALHHRVLSLPGKSRLYEGAFVGEHNGISLVAGRWKNIPTPVAKPAQTQSGAAVSAAAAQEEGLWVATKP
ncbi:MAG TPA: hypothetical protein VGO68_06530 [Pyrinomonadaceae bacterium]|jgi:hypothetical protein|nr:hypothetical protein [Pyrinomonadaceae bacterium]